MSAGHHHRSQRHTPALIREFHRLLDDPRVREYLAAPYRVSYSYDIPLTGGSNIKGNVIYIDPDVPKSLRPYVIWHERYEKAFREAKRMGYNRAHELATVGERLHVEADKRDWTGYKKAIAGPVRGNEKRGKTKVPPDIDPGPYKASGMMNLISEH